MKNGSKKILITGASGFIGGFLVERALERGYDVYAGVRASSNKKYLSDARIKFIDLNYADKEKLTAQIAQFKAQQGACDFIIHNAGITKCKRKGDFDRINFGFTKNFVEAICAADARPQAFVYMSSLSAWGAGNEKNLEPIKLSDPPKPNTAYGKSKIKSEKFISSVPDFPYIFMRPTGVYGPREKDYAAFVDAVRRGIVPSIGFKPQYLTFIYVKDLTKAIFDAIEKGATRKAYFVSDGKVYTSKEYAQIVKTVLGKKFTIPVCVPLWLMKTICVTFDTVGGWFGKSPLLNRDKYNILKARNWKCEVEPLQHDINFVADYDLQRGVQEIENLKKNEKN